VFRAIDPVRDRAVAVKLFMLDLPPERVHLLVTEFERLIAAALDHPALNAPLATGIVEASAYLVHDCVDAQSLDRAVREYGPAPPAHAVRVAAQLAGALDFAAAVNVTHGALHPRDVLLSASEVRVTGVGISHALETVGITPPVRRPYSAPERVENARWDRRADVFSLAALVHELLWAHRIGGLGGEAAAALTAVSGGDLPALRAAFARALAHDPGDRYATALEFAEALSEAFPEVAGEPPPAGTDRADAQHQRGSRETAPPTPPAPLLPLEDQTDEPAVVAAAAPETADLRLQEAEEERYRDVEAAPAIVEPALAAAPQAIEVAPAEPEPVPVVVTRSRSVLWPVAAALAIGIGLGFFGGYGFGNRDRTTAAPIVSTEPPANTPAPATPATSPAPPGREFTEGTVAAPPAQAPPKSETTPASAAATPPPSAADREPSALGAQPSPALRGRVLVRSTPAGARVAVDGREYGLTPVAVRDLASGLHRVRVSREGYAPVERRVTITASRPAQSITVPLERATAAARTSGSVAPAGAGAVDRFVGTLVVDSRPSGAKVYLDGRLIGATPLSMRDVRAGEHAVRLEHDGYRRWSGSVRVVAAEQNRVTASLER
jgi:eukaryotic-like serine/threonine-protein kinase